MVFASSSTLASRSISRAAALNPEGPETTTRQGLGRRRNELVGIWLRWRPIGSHVTIAKESVFGLGWIVFRSTCGSVVTVLGLKLRMESIGQQRLQDKFIRQLLCCGRFVIIAQSHVTQAFRQDGRKLRRNSRTTTRFGTAIAMQLKGHFRQQGRLGSIERKKGTVLGAALFPHAKEQRQEGQRGLDAKHV